MGIEILIRLMALFLAGLATGGLMVNWIGLARAMARISSAAAYTEFHQATNRTFQPYMPIVVFGAIAGGIALAVASSGVHSASGWLAICGAICYAAVIVITLPTDLPTNKAIAGWSVQSPPDNWKTIRAGWIRWPSIGLETRTKPTSGCKRRLEPSTYQRPACAGTGGWNCAYYGRKPKQS